MNGWHVPTAVVVGRDGVGPWLARRPLASAVVVADAAVAGGELVGHLAGQLAEAGARTTVHVHRPGPDAHGGTDGAAALAPLDEMTDRVRAADVVVGVGGGSVLDGVKLAVVAADADVARLLRVPQPSGLVPLPPVDRGGRRLFAVPTTLGTGSELSPVAVLVAAGRRRLVTGAALQPDGALLDPRATATLPTGLVVEAAFEVLTRLLGPYVGGTDQTVEDALVAGMAATAAALGTQAARAHVAGRRLADDRRLALAKLSGLSHAGWVVAGRDPFSSRPWYLANELATVAGVRKVTALAAVLPVVWRRVLAGDVRWGSADRLRRIWAVVGPATAGDGGPPPDDDPVAGLRTVIDTWRLPGAVPLAPGDVREVARRGARAWGSGLPMLGAFTVGDLEAVVAEAVTDRGGPQPTEASGGEALAAHAVVTRQ